MADGRRAVTGRAEVPGLAIRRGTGWSLSAAFFAAAYLIPYRAAAAASSAAAVVLPLLLWAAVLNSVTSIAGAWRERPRFDRLTCLVAVVLGVGTIVGNVAVAEALSLAEPGVVSVLLRTQVLFVALLGWWLLHEPVTLRFGLGVVLALAGFVLMHGAPGSGSTAGMLWSALAALAFAVIQIVTRRVIHRIQPVLVNGLRLWCAVLLLLCWPGQGSLLRTLSGSLWLLTGAAALVGPFISRICVMWALRYIPAATCTLIALVGPVFAFALGIIFFGVWPTPREALGSLVVLAGISLPVVEMTRTTRGGGPAVGAIHQPDWGEEPWQRSDSV